MTEGGATSSWIDRVMRFCLENKLIVVLFLLFVSSWGVLVAPFDWKIEGVPRDPVPVDAIPDTGENQQIVFTKWPGRSPQDVEDQVTYPLTVALLGVPGVKTIRSNSAFGFSSIFVIFKESVEFYWSRSRILEKLSSLPTGTLPDGVQPSLGPDATPLGQVFWYTLEGRDSEGDPTGGWDLHTLRTIQDWKVRYALSSVDGVAEVASIGGHVQEYQIDVDPAAMRAYDVTLDDVFSAVRRSNVDVGARSIEINRVEYVVRGRGLIKTLEDIEDTVVGVSENVPITVRQIAKVRLGPALRRGALDKGGAEAVGGVVVVRYGANPLAVIQRVKDKIEQISVGLPRKNLADGRESQVRIIPFYDRSGLIHETLGTLNHALRDQILVTIIVVLVMLAHLRSAILISGLLPLSVLMCFIAMKQFGRRRERRRPVGHRHRDRNDGRHGGRDLREHPETHRTGTDGEGPTRGSVPRCVGSRFRGDDCRPDHRDQLPAGVHDGGSRGQVVQAARVHEDLRAARVHRRGAHDHPADRAHSAP